MKKTQKRKPRKWIIVLLVIVLVIAALGGGGLLWYKSSLGPAGKSEETEEITIAQGETADQLIKDLAEKKLIKSELAASLYYKMNPSTYYPGTYMLSKGMSVEEIMKYVSDEQNQVSSYQVVTIIPGYWAKQVAAVLDQKFPQYSAQDFLNLWNSQEYIETLAKDYTFLDPAKLKDDRLKVKLEGYLYPETYFLDNYMTPDQITRTFLDQFQKVYDELEPQIKASGKSLEEILTLASIVQFESGDAKEMPNIAGVFENRLAKDMMLQSSVTVCYALYDQFTSAKDCETNPEIDSPYNTYINHGLPIGPILNPDKQAIEAVLNPAKHDYLYFVSDIHGDGAIHYAKTYEEHEENIKMFNLND